MHTGDERNKNNQGDMVLMNNQIMRCYMKFNVWRSESVNRRIENQANGT